jgi:hypothetical protein
MADVLASIRVDHLTPGIGERPSRLHAVRVGSVLLREHADQKASPTKALGLDGQPAQDGHRRRVGRPRRRDVVAGHDM